MPDEKAKAFYVALPPSKDYRTTGVPLAVVEGYVKDDRLFIVAPEAMAGDDWPFRRFGGWVKTDGPARTLSSKEYLALVDGLPQHVVLEVVAQTQLALLTNGQRMSRPLVRRLYKELLRLHRKNPLAMHDLIELSSGQISLKAVSARSRRHLFGRRFLKAQHGKLPYVDQNVIDVLHSSLQSDGQGVGFFDPVVA